MVEWEKVDRGWVEWDVDRKEHSGNGTEMVLCRWWEGGCYQQ